MDSWFPYSIIVIQNENKSFIEVIEIITEPGDDDKFRRKAISIQNFKRFRAGVLRHRLDRGHEVTQKTP